MKITEKVKKKNFEKRQELNQKLWIKSLKTNGWKKHNE